MLAGDPLSLYVTTTAPSFTVNAFRLGWYGGDKARLVWTSPSVPGHVQAPAVADVDRRVTDNLFTAMAAGPMGAAHPAWGNLSSLDVPAGSETGTGGALAPAR